MSYFFTDTITGQVISWNNLITDVNRLAQFNSYCHTEDYYEVFKSIIISMILGREIILLDSDYSKDELVTLTGLSEYEKYNQLFERDENTLISDKSDLVKKLRSTNNQWKVTMFTSGTTGVPKRVSHNYESITRFVKYYEKNYDSVWGFAYNPTHMAGLQVFMQALLNCNQIVRLFGMSPDSIKHEIQTKKITHLSATPTFYRLLLPFEEEFSSVQRITSGGEKFSDGVMQALKDAFPNAKFTNVYASTEAGTLFASEGDVFTVKPGFESLVKILNNELVIHQNLIASDFNSFNDGWYHTGDQVEQVSDDPVMFRFVSRITEMINVGGYKVNPTEVEDTLCMLKGIRQARVYSKSNSVLGNIVCCEVVCDNQSVGEKSIRTFLSSKLQEFKVPRVIRFVDKIKMTRTGKVERNTL